MAFKNIDEITYISPSVYLNLEKCFLMGVWVSNNKPHLLPQKPEAYLGQLVHRINDLALRGQIYAIEEFDDIWDCELGALENKILTLNIGAHLIPLKDHIKDYEVSKELCRIFVAELLKNSIYMISKGDHLRKRIGVSKGTSGEKMLVVEEMSIKGRLDVIINNGNDIEIIDYKTGNIYENSSGEKKIKKDIITQLVFYSGLYYYAKDKWPSKLSIITKSGEKINIDYTPMDSVQLINSAQCMKFTINSIIKSPLISIIDKLQILARPSKKTCHFCKYRPACIAYTQKRISNPWSGWPKDIFATVDSIEVTMTKKANIIASLLGTDKKIRVTNIPSVRDLCGLECGDKIGIYNLLDHKGSAERFDWQPDSVIQGLHNLLQVSNRDQCA